MQDATIQPMYPGMSVHKDTNKRVWKVVIIERDEMGAWVENNPNEITYKSNVTYDEAGSFANQWNQDAQKLGLCVYPSAR